MLGPPGKNRLGYVAMLGLGIRLGLCWATWGYAYGRGGLGSMWGRLVVVLGQLEPMLSHLGPRGLDWRYGPG